MSFGSCKKEDYLGVDGFVFFYIVFSLGKNGVMWVLWVRSVFEPVGWREEMVNKG